MVVDEITKSEQERFPLRAVSQGRLGAWTQWDATVIRRITWGDIWGTLQYRP